ncbi:MAG: hypothetical protein FWG47_08235, partial [Propionibacteriaceae bacterium]|nr:hypothetical protein [Propionibacteriaceae bacterium]
TCIGIDITVSPEYQLSVNKAVREYPLVALRAKKAGLLNDLQVLVSFSESTFTADLEQRMSTHGCDEGLMEDANALSALGVKLSQKLEICARSNVMSITRSSTLETLVLAEVDRSQVDSLLNAIPYQMQEWTMVRESSLLDWPEPLGFGTLEATRDATELLQLVDQERPPWIENGVGRAVEAYVSGEMEPSERQASDLLFLCTVVSGNCPQGLRDIVAKTINSINVAAVTDDDGMVARMVETAVVARLEVPVKCTSELASNWMTTSPLTLLALSSIEANCIELAGFTEQELALLSLQAIRANAPEHAAAYSNMRKHLVPVMNDQQQHEEMSAQWEAYLTRLETADVEDYVGKARPVRFELIRARFFDAIS